MIQGKDDFSMITEACKKLEVPIEELVIGNEPY